MSPTCADKVPDLCAIDSQQKVFLPKQYKIMGLLSFLFGSDEGNTALRETIQPGALLVDVRTAAEFSTGSVKGAVNIPLDKIAAQLNKLKGKPQIVVFCRSGNRSGMAKGILEQNGFQNVVNGGTWLAVKQAVEG